MHLSDHLFCFQALRQGTISSRNICQQNTMTVLTISWNFWTARIQWKNTHPPQLWSGGVACSEMPSGKKQSEKRSSSREQEQFTEDKECHWKQNDNNKKSTKQQQNLKNQQTLQHYRARRQWKLCFKKCLNFPCQMKSRISLYPKEQLQEQPVTTYNIWNVFYVTYRLRQYWHIYLLS